MVGTSGTAGVFEEKSLENLLYESVYSERDGVNHFARTDDARMALLQLRVLGLGLLQDRDVRIRVFPEREEVLVSGSCIIGVALESVGAGKAEPSEHT